MSLTKNQKLFLGNGGLWSMYDGLTTMFLIAFAIYLGASNTVIGLLGALPYISIVASQAAGVSALNRYSRKSIYLLGTTIGRLVWLPILLIPLFATSHPLVWLVALFFVCKFLEYLTDPAWTSLAADVVPESSRGVFFSRRLFMIGILSMLAFLGGGFILDLFPKTDNTGFTIIFTAGIILGLLATWILWGVKEPPSKSHTVHSFKDFGKDWSGDFGKFLLFGCVFNFATMIASPFFTAFMLKDLGLSYSLFVIANAISFTAKTFAQTVWGPISDKDGDKPIAMMCAFGTGLIPLSFLFITPETLWLIIPAQIISGIVWAGMELASFNLLLDLTDRNDRPFQVAEYQTITSIPMIIGPIIGGFIADSLSLGFLAGIPLVFAVAMVLRFSSVFFLTSIPERRGPANLPMWAVAKEVMSVMSVKGVYHHVATLKRWSVPK